MHTATKTYPPGMEEQRAAIMQMVGDVKARYEAKANPPVDVTATSIAAYCAPRTPEHYADLQRAYQAEIDPLVKLLVEIEACATITVQLPA